MRVPLAGRGRRPFAGVRPAAGEGSALREAGEKAREERSADRSGEPGPRPSRELPDEVHRSSRQAVEKGLRVPSRQPEQQSDDRESDRAEARTPRETPQAQQKQGKVETAGPIAKPSQKTTKVENPQATAPTSAGAGDSSWSRKKRYALTRARKSVNVQEKRKESSRAGRSRARSPDEGRSLPRPETEGSRRGKSGPRTESFRWRTPRGRRFSRACWRRRRRRESDSGQGRSPAPPVSVSRGRGRSRGPPAHRLPRSGRPSR